MRTLYAGAATVAAPGLRALLRHRVGKGKEVAARLPEREGVDATPRPVGHLVWIHAASVGEVVSVLPVVACVRRAGPTVLVTTGTVTSATVLETRVAALGLSGVLHRFVPLDVPGWAQRFVRHWRPDVAVFVESELWPNLFAACRASGVPAMLVNGRMSARSLRGWRRAQGLAREMLGGLVRVHAQSADDADRLRALGARVADAPGNLKLAAAPLPVDEAELARLRTLLSGAPAWLAASTHPGEEAVAADVHRTLLPAHARLVTIMAPRHPERGGEVAASLGARARSRGQDPVPGQPWVADTMGELGLLYRLAPVVFVGRSLVGHGGQNVLEPARLGCAVATGPHTENFRDAVGQLRAGGALQVVADAGSLADWVDAMLCDPVRRQTAGEAARHVAEGEIGLVERVAESILALLR